MVVKPTDTTTSTTTTGTTPVGSVVVKPTDTTTSTSVPPVVVIPKTTTSTTTTATKPITYTPGSAENLPFTSGLVNPGLNPGWMLQGANQPFYNTTSPTQDTYYWGAHPYAMNMGDLASYNNVPTAPATPFGTMAGQATPTRAPTGPGTLQQQLEHAWNTGDYATVNSLVGTNHLTDTQAQSIWGISPSQAKSAGITNLIQSTPPTPMTSVPGTSTATTTSTTS